MSYAIEGEGKDFFIAEATMGLKFIDGVLYQAWHLHNKTESKVEWRVVQGQ